MLQVWSNCRFILGSSLDCPIPRVFWKIFWDSRPRPSYFTFGVDSVPILADGPGPSRTGHGPSALDQTRRANLARLNQPDGPPKPDQIEATN